jgi:hypothetical protein
MEVFSNGHAAVNMGGWYDGKWGLIDTKGNEVVPLIYDNVKGFSDGLAVVNIGNDWSFIDTNGDEIKLPGKYSDINRFSDERAMTRTAVDKVNPWDDRSKFGFLDTQGNEVVAPVFDLAKDFSQGLAAVRIGGWQDGKWGFIDKDGKVIVPFIFDDAHSFSEGLAWVKQGDKWGILQIEQ